MQELPPLKHEMPVYTPLSVRFWPLEDSTCRGSLEWKLAKPRLSRSETQGRNRSWR